MITQRTISLFLLALCTLADNSNFFNLANSPLQSPDDGADTNLLGSSWTIDQGNNDPLQAVSAQQANPDSFFADQSPKCNNHQTQTRRRQLRFKRAPDDICHVEKSGGTQTTTESGQQAAPNVNESSKKKPVTEPNTGAVPDTPAGTPNSGICGDGKALIPLCFLPTPDEPSRVLTILLTPCRARK